MESKKNKTPEERELEKKAGELSELESLLVQKELELATVQAELRQFERQYIGTVGVLYSELDNLEALLAEASAKSKPNDSKAQQAAVSARAKATETSKAIKSDSPDKICSRNEFTPSDELKKLYREVAKKIHPDLSLDKDEREKRQKLMAEANAAYAAGNEQALREILNEWLSSPDSVVGDGPGAELVRVIRKISQIQTRLSKIDSEIDAIKRSELFQLKKSFDEAKSKNRDIFTEMSAKVTVQINQIKEQLNIQQN